MTPLERKAYAKSYYSKNREKLVLASRLWKKNNPERHRAYKKQWQRDHPESQRRYRLENKEKIKSVRRIYVSKHKDHIRDLNRDWCKRNFELLKIRKRNWFLKNKTRLREMNIYSIYRNRNHDRYKERETLWRKNNAEKVRMKSRASAAMRYAAGGYLSKETIDSVYSDNIKKYGALTCALCLLSIQKGDDSLEHLTPLSRGGTNEYSNLAIAHRKCNSRKNKKTVNEFKQLCAAGV
jgi:5-methylcytosine-specific restriction endonuclease McrA